MAGLEADIRAVSIADSADIRRAAEAFRDIGRARGQYRILAADNIASKQPMIDAEGNILAATVFGFTAGKERWWLDTKVALTSPFARIARYESEPFLASEQGIITRQPNSYLDAIDLSQWSKRIRTPALIGLPVHLPFGQIGIVGLDVPGEPNKDLRNLFEADGDYMHILAQRFITGYVKVMRRRMWLPADCMLTKREVECLRWAAIGKTDKEISIILSRSHATVRFHIQNAGEKLGAVNRSQAIFKAAQLGYLGFAA